MPTSPIAITDDEIRGRLLRYLELTGVDDAATDGMYDDDSILEFPQSGERFRGHANIAGFRAEYPADVRLEVRHLLGSGAHWVAEVAATYDGAETWLGVTVLELRGATVERERIYFAQPFDAPEWRAPWREA